MMKKTLLALSLLSSVASYAVDAAPVAAPAPAKTFRETVTGYAASAKDTAVTGFNYAKTNLTNPYVLGGVAAAVVAVVAYKYITHKKKASTKAAF